MIGPIFLPRFASPNIIVQIGVSLIAAWDWWLLSNSATKITNPFISKISLVAIFDLHECTHEMSVSLAK